MDGATLTLSASELAEHLGFALDELALNRQGMLSARQRQTLRYDAIGHLLRGSGTLVLGAILLATVGPRAHTSAAFALLVLAAGALVSVAGLWAYACWRVWHPAVRTIRGPLRRGTDPWHPAVIVGEEALRISPRRWRRLPAQPGGTYCAYVDPSGRLLSIAPCEEPA